MGGVRGQVDDSGSTDYVVTRRTGATWLLQAGAPHYYHRPLSISGELVRGKPGCVSSKIGSLLSILFRLKSKMREKEHTER